MPFENNLLIQASAAHTTSGNSGNLDVGGFNEFLILINVSAASGTTPTLNFFVDSSPDQGTSWVQIASGAQLTGVSTQNIPLGAGSSATPALFGEMIRLRWTIAGTTPSFTFNASGIGK